MLALGLLAHGEAGGHLPAIEVLVLLGALLLAVTAFAVRRRIRWPGGLALAGLGQLAMHEVFSFLGGSCTPSALPVALAPGEHAHAVVGSYVHGTCAGADPAAMSLGMLVWHTVATVLTVGLLVGTERGVWLLASWLTRPLVVRTVRLPADRQVPVPGALTTPVSAVDVHVAPVRGPPPSTWAMHLVA